MAKPTNARVQVEPKAILILERMASLEGRFAQRNLGMCLERIAAAFEHQPEKLVELGLITQTTAKLARSA